MACGGANNPFDGFMSGKRTQWDLKSENGEDFDQKDHHDHVFHKKVLKEGEGVDFPNEGALVKLKLIGKLQDNTVFLNKGYSDGDEAELFEFKTDEEQVIDGLDKAVMTMKKGEVALLTIPPQYAFGSSESQQELAVVPPNSTLYYEVELVSFVKAKEAWDMNTKEKIEAALKKDEEGLALYRANECARASKKAQKAIKFVEDDTSFSDAEREIVTGLKFSCNVLSAICMTELGDYEQKKRFEELLDFKPVDPKTLALERSYYLSIGESYMDYHVEHFSGQLTANGSRQCI